ncbi:thiamine pyrophosphokinase [Ophiobolus disseminans]|uniref:Thiamine pyrophosphokinase n=1 Tax=Ophiobolus disseminans TaxID=1469910 RepID=A0A6A6ZQY6_9PLEO|nr:thiamine pyrophosphokinase [Ophiobolus disseminans]
MSLKSSYSNLDLVARVDSSLQMRMKNYYYFMIDGFPKPFGYVHTSTISRVSWDEHWAIDAEHRFLTLNGGDTFAERTWRMEETSRPNLKVNSSSVFGRWCDELFPLYDDDGQHILDMDGAGVDAFGIVNYTCHLIAYVKTSEGTKYWVPRRAKTKLSHPNMLDNTVGGSLASGEKPVDYIYTRANITACGALSYSMTQTDDGRPGCQHQVQYLYEMEMLTGIVLTPNDGEAQDFQLNTLENVVCASRKSEFKLNCAMTWMAFLIRHGHVNAENESNFMEISARLHRRHDLFIVKWTDKRGMD